MNEFRPILTFAYCAVTLVVGGTTMFHGDIWRGLSEIFAPLLALIAGGGIMEGRSMPSHPAVGVILLGVTFFAISTYWAHHAGWLIRIENITLSGVAVCFIGFAMGLLFYRPTDYQDGD